LRGSRFVRDVVMVASGTAVAQAVTVIFTPFITRMYGPEAFGVLGLFIAAVTVFNPVATLAYPIAIILPRDDVEALGLVRLSVIISFGTALLTTVMLLWGGAGLAGVLGIETINAYLYLIPVIMLFNAWAQIASQWLIRKKEFAVISSLAILHSLASNSMKGGVGWFYPTTTVLIGLAIIGSGLQAALLFVGTIRANQKAAMGPTFIANSSLVKLAKRHSAFPLYHMPQMVINAASRSLPVIMLAAFFGPAAAGFYTLAQMVLGLPANLIGKAVSDVIYPRFAKAAADGRNISRQIMQATGILLVTGSLLFGLIALWGPWLFSFVFGQEWALAGEYARWLSLFFLFNFINKPCVAAVPVIGVQRGLLVYEFFSTGVKVFGLAIGCYWFDSSVWAVALFSIFGAIAYCVMMLWIYTNSLKWSADEKTS
jgi:O-antigen/teichoic acid export membrane protein